MTRHLTAGVDGSPESRWAAAWAADEAVLRNLPLRIVHADDWPVSVAVPVDGFETQHRWSDEMLTEVTNNLRERHPGLEITTQRLSARPPAALAAEASEAELLVLGSRGLSRITGFLIGSVGLATIGATERPVVLVRAAEQPDDGPPPARIGPYRDLIVGVDVNQSCDALLAFAFDEAARRDCTLRAVYGWSLPPGAQPGSHARSGSPPRSGRGSRPRARRPPDALAAEVSLGGRRRTGACGRTRRAADLLHHRRRSRGRRQAHPQVPPGSSHRPHHPRGDPPLPRARRRRRPRLTAVPGWSVLGRHDTTCCGQGRMGTHRGPHGPSA